MFKRPNSQKGYTLIEIMVSMTAFIIVFIVIAGIFILGINQQRRALVLQSVLDQASYSLEFMGRALRMAKKEVAAPACLSQNGLNYELTRSGYGIKFINSLEGNDCQEFYLATTTASPKYGQLQYRKKIGVAGETTLDLTSQKLEVASSTLKFNLTGAAQGDNIQPRVTIFLEFKGKGVIEASQKIKIQTTISQRNLDVQY